MFAACFLQLGYHGASCRKGIMVSIHSLSTLNPARNIVGDRTGILTIQQLFHGTVGFEVPGNQRSYEWGKPQVSDFIDDLQKSATRERYFGTAIFSGGGNKFGIVDGQQRMTTISLLMLAIQNKFSSPRFPPNSVQSDLLALSSELLFVDPILKTLKISFPTNHLFPQLQSETAQNVKAFVQKNAKKNKATSAHRIAKAYEILSGHLDGIANSVSDLKDLYRSLTETALVVAIVIGKNDQATQLFEAVNARGLALTETDKIKNWLFGVSTLRGKAIPAMNKFNKDWGEILEHYEVTAESLLGGPSLEEFLHYYSMFSYGQQVKLKALYPNIISIVSQGGLSASDQDAKKFLEGFKQVLTSFGEILQKINLTPREREIKEGLYRLSKLNNHFAFAWVVRSFMIGLAASEVCEVIKLGETFAFRERIIGQQMSQAVYQKNVIDYAISIKSVSDIPGVRRKLRQNSISDLKFKDELISKKWHRSKDKVLAQYALRRFESISFPPVPFDSAQHVEHIVPKTNGINSPWQFTTNDSDHFNDNNLNKLGNFLILHIPCNVHIQNKLIGFKIQNNVKVARGSSAGNLGLCPRGNGKWVDPIHGDCIRHYVRQIYPLTKDFSTSPKWAAELQALVIASTPAARFKAANDLIQTRTEWLAEQIIVKKVWEY
jgi:Protein of unknown function DUF262/Protein of unknown function (DUF1524)